MNLFLACNEFTLLPEPRAALSNGAHAPELSNRLCTAAYKAGQRAITEPGAGEGADVYEAGTESKGQLLEPGTVGECSAEERV